MDHYLFLSSADTFGIFTGNHAGNFKVRLPQEIDCVESQWELALIDYDLPRQPKGALSVKICVDICEPSPCGSNLLPIVRVVPALNYRDQLSNPIYIKVRPQKVREVNVYLLNLKGKGILDIRGTCTVTLHLRQTPLRLV